MTILCVCILGLNVWFMLFKRNSSMFVRQFVSLPGANGNFEKFERNS